LASRVESLEVIVESIVRSLVVTEWWLGELVISAIIVVSVVVVFGLDCVGRDAGFVTI